MISKLGKKVTIDPSLSGDDWQLYTQSRPEECESAAQALNAALGAAVNCGKRRPEVQAAVWAVMAQLSKTGAYDTEPRGVLEDILDDVFGPKPAPRSHR
jgi:hypothetical protein